MNDKKFIKTKVRKSLKKLLVEHHTSGHSLMRLHLLSEIVASLLIGGESKVNKVSEHMNTGRRKLESVKKQVSRFFQISTFVSALIIYHSSKNSYLD